MYTKTKKLPIRAHNMAIIMSLSVYKKKEKKGGKSLLVRPKNKLLIFEMCELTTTRVIF